MSPLELDHAQQEADLRVWALVRKVGHLDCGGWHWDSSSPAGLLVCRCSAVLMATHGGTGAAQ